MENLLEILPIFSGNQQGCVDDGPPIDRQQLNLGHLNQPFYEDKPQQAHLIAQIHRLHDLRHELLNLLLARQSG